MFFMGLFTPYAGKSCRFCRSQAKLQIAVGHPALTIAYYTLCRREWILFRRGAGRVGSRPKSGYTRRCALMSGQESAVESETAQPWKSAWH